MHTRNNKQNTNGKELLPSLRAVAKGVVGQFQGCAIMGHTAFHQTNKLDSMPKVKETYLLNMRMISLLSLFTMVFSFLSQRIGTVYLPAQSVQLVPADNHFAHQC